MISTTRRRRSAGTGTGGIGSGGAGSTGAPLVVDGRVQIQATPTAASDSDGAQQTVRDVRAVLHVLPGGDRMLVGRTTAIHLDTLDNSKLDLRVIPAILIAVLLVLILLLRSWVAPLLLVAATVLSFGTALGVSALIFNSVFYCPKADPAVTLFALVFLVAIGIDYLIFLMTRAREEVALHGPKEGVLRAVRVTGGVITSAGIVLAKTSAVLAVIPILFLAQIAFIVAFGVLGGPDRTDPAGPGAVLRSRPIYLVADRTETIPAPTGIGRDCGARGIPDVPGPVAGHYLFRPALHRGWVGGPLGSCQERMVRVGKSGSRAAATALDQISHGLMKWSMDSPADAAACGPLGRPTELDHRLVDRLVVVTHVIVVCRADPVSGGVQSWSHSHDGVQYGLLGAFAARGNRILVIPARSLREEQIHDCPFHREARCRRLEKTSGHH